MDISVCSEQGVRSRQQDSYGLFRLGIWECFAVADGYGTPQQAYEHLSSTVISLALRVAIELLEKDPDITVQTYERFFKEIFAYIDRQTRHFVAGSTLAIAFHKRDSHVFYTAALGDSPLVRLDPKEIDINPWEHLHRGKEKLWGSFGDAVFASHHQKEPECRVLGVSSGQALLIGSDGMFSNHQPEIIMRESAEYADAVLRHGASAHDLVRRAHQEKQTNDNATAILIRL